MIKWFQFFWWKRSKRNPSIATHTTNIISDTDTTNGISTQTLFINPTIQANVRPITLLVTAKVDVTQESLIPRQASLLKANATDAACPCARIFRTTGNKIRTEGDRVTPRDASSSEKRSKAISQRSTFVATSIPPTRIGNQDIFSPSNPITARRGRNAKPFDTSINGFSAVNERSTFYLSGISGVETVSS